MNSGKIVAGRVDGKSKVLQEVLADLKIGSEGELFIGMDIPHKVILYTPG